MGGDEVSERCWNASDDIQQFMMQHRWDLDKSSFLNLWDYFQRKAQEKVYKETIGAHLTSAGRRFTTTALQLWLLTTKTKF
ncbi:hypothetical protein MSG28_006359 [Choristoneura fumiferana]|uniref:Uncharacterized protein n=1 Tax=Choristoneura fumiferana TaxID=7141 RepID=A0ACC0JEP8_CHOFU|nr:hypothetical protein MSG28_006359 [Choristoneura fumiferana]